MALLLLISDRAPEADDVNAQITRLFGFIVVLFVLLIVFTTRWTVIDKSSKLDDNALNQLTLIQELKIKRGRILADDGTVLAKSVPAGGGTWSAHVSDRAVVRAGGRILEPRAGAGRRARAVRRRLHPRACRPD